jgi:hypothetical protein
MNKNILIMGLIVVIAILLFLMDPRGNKTYSDPDVQRYESVIGNSQLDIINIVNKQAELIKKAKDDSIRFADERVKYKREIARYKKKLASINYDVATSDELDSIRLSIYKPGDSTYIVAGPDPLYSMPISQARDALEAKAREPMYDSINTLQASRIDSLETQAIASEELYKETLKQVEQKFDASQNINSNLQLINDHFRKKEKKQVFKDWGNRLIGAGLGFAAGKL